MMQRLKSHNALLLLPPVAEQKSRKNSTPECRLPSIYDKKAGSRKHEQRRRCPENEAELWMQIAEQNKSEGAATDTGATDEAAEERATQRSLSQLREAERREARKKVKCSATHVYTYTSIVFHSSIHATLVK
jgi:hypothetical protein